MMLSIANAFIDRTAPGASTIEIEKIACHDHRWKLTQVKANSFYQVSQKWLPICGNYVGEVIQSFQENNIQKLKAIYINISSQD